MVRLFSNDISRRSFLQLTAAATAAAGLVERPSLSAAAEEGEKAVDACCPSLALCTAVCPLKVTVKGGRITHIASHPEYKSCPKGLAQRVSVYDPDRLKYPLKRAGERGEGKFRRISWDEALDLYAGKIKEISAAHGNQAILWYPGRGTGGLARLAAKQRFAA